MSACPQHRASVQCTLHIPPPPCLHIWSLSPLWIPVCAVTRTNCPAAAAHQNHFATTTQKANQTNADYDPFKGDPWNKGPLMTFFKISWSGWQLFNHFSMKNCLILVSNAKPFLLNHNFFPHAVKWLFKKCNKEEYWERNTSDQSCEISDQPPQYYCCSDVRSVS